jgi:hypothetical protein
VAQQQLQHWSLPNAAPSSSDAQVNEGINRMATGTDMPAASQDVPNTSAAPPAAAALAVAPAGQDPASSSLQEHLSCFESLLGGQQLQLLDVSEMELDDDRLPPGFEVPELQETDLQEHHSLAMELLAAAAAEAATAGDPRLLRVRQAADSSNGSSNADSSTDADSGSSCSSSRLRPPGTCQCA